MTSTKDHVSYSQLRTWQRCAYKGHLEYDLGLVPRVTRPGFREGRIGDLGLQALYGNFKRTGMYDPEIMVAAMKEAAHEESERIAAVADLAPEEWDEYRARVDTLCEIGRAYVRWAFEHDDFFVVGTQTEGRIPVVTPNGRASTKYDFVYRVDAIIIREGRLWIREDKWWKDLRSDALKMLPQDEQSAEYLWALNVDLQRNLHKMPQDMQDAVRECGYPQGILYNVIRKKLPTVPKLLKDGSTSRDKSIDTTREVYIDTLLERGQDPQDYRDITDLLRDKGNTFFYRDELTFNQDELAEVGERVYELTRLRSAHFRAKHRTRDCSWDCPYLPICIEWSDDVVANHYQYKVTVPEKEDEE